VLTQAGIAAATSALGTRSADLALAVPWSALVLVGVGAILAGMLSAAVPAGRAGRVSPVQALARA